MEAVPVEMVPYEDKLERIRLQINSKLDNQKQLAIILSAVEENIEEQKTKKSEVAYFVSFLELLSQSINNDQIIDLNLATVSAYFLDLFFPYLAPQLLRSRFSDILAMLAPALTNEAAEAPLIRSSVGALESLLLAQDHSAWNSSASVSPRRGLYGLLELSLDPRPKVRKRAQDAVHKVLATPPPGPKVEHPAAVLTAEFVLESLVELLKARNKNKTHTDKDLSSKMIHNLQLLTAITSANAWPSKQIEPLCDALLELSKTTDQYLVSGVFNAFEGLFSSMNDDEIDKNRFVAVLDIIFDLKPAVNDVHLAASWLAVVAKAVSSYASVDPLACLSKLPDIFRLVLQYFSSESENIYVSASQCLIAIIVEGIDDNALLLPSKKNGISGKTYEIVDEVITQIAGITLTLCDFKYSHAAREVMELLTTIFNKFRMRSNPDFLPHLEQVGNWRSDEDRFQYKAEAEAVIAAALLALGPEVVLSVLPLNLDKPQLVGRAWLLPLLRDNIRNAKLGFYIAYFTPLLQFFSEKVDNAEDKQSMHIKIFQTIIDQIWSLLPHFCDLPLDLRTAFSDDFAAKLASLLYEKVELRVTICHALKLLVESNIVYSEGALADDLMMQQQFPEKEAKKNVEYLATKASKILSVLFNVFTQTAASSRSYVLETIEAYLQITPKDELEATFNKVCGILKNAMDEEAAKPPQQKQKQNDDFPALSITMMDLVVAMAKYVPESSHIALLAIFNQTLTYPDASIQKRSYRILSRLFETEAGVDSAKNFLRDIETSIIKSADSCIPTAKASRLTAIDAIIDVLPPTDLYFIPSVLSEVILSTKNVNEKTRDMSYSALIKMGNKMEQGGIVENSKVPSMDPDMPDSEANLETYFTMCSAGLVGSTPHMVSAAITALSCLLYEFRPKMNTELLIEISSTVELFLESNNREIVKSAIGFVKVAVLTLPIEIVAGNLNVLLPQLMRWSHEHKGHFKSKIKHIIERMIRRFGYDTIDANFPEQDKKLLVNIKKSKDRAKRKQKEDPEQEQQRRPEQKTFSSAYDEALYKSSDEEESDEEMDEPPRRGGKTNDRFISESKDAPLDLLDRQAISRVTSSNPKHNRRSQLAADSYKTKNGKLVIQEDEGDDPFKGTDSGLSAYVEAVKQGPIRGQRNKLKFKRGKNAKDEDGFDDDVEEEAPRSKVNFNKKSRNSRITKPRSGGPKFKSKKKL